MSTLRELFSASIDEGESHADVLLPVKRKPSRHARMDEVVRGLRERGRDDLAEVVLARAVREVAR